MDIQKAVTIAGEAVAFLTALTTFLGTIRNGLTHLGWLSPDEATKFGKFLDRMSWVAQKGSSGLATLPGLASKPAAPALAAVPAPRGDKGSAEIRTVVGISGLSLVFLLLVLAGIFMSGCATVSTPANATTGQKFAADLTAVKQMAADIKAKCPKLADISGLVADAITVATDPYNLVGDVMAAARAYPDLQADYASIKCAVQVILDEYKALRPAATPTSPVTAAAKAKITVLEQALEILDQPGAADLQCASPASP